MIKGWPEAKYFNLSNTVYRINADKVISLAVSEIKRGKITSVLDLGCNNNCMIKVVQGVAGNNDIFYCGLDFDMNALIEDTVKGTALVQADANQCLPFKDGVFDLIVSNQLLEHLHQVDTFFKEVHRILREGGTAIISTPNLAAWHNILFLILGWHPTSAHIIDVQVGNPMRGIKTCGHVRLFTYKALKEFCDIYNFKLEEILGIGHYPFKGKIGSILDKIDIRHCVYFILKISKL